MASARADFPAVARPAASSVLVAAARSVFVNCPFDDDYLPLLHALLFTIHDCGFVGRVAVEDIGAGEMRIEKIVRLIRDSRLSIHDISRIQLSGPAKLPRFNMPFEAGVAFGAVRFDGKLDRDMLLLDAVPFQDRKTLSDLAGQDTRAHDNDPRLVVKAVRAFLARKTPPGQRTRGELAIWTRYQAYLAALPAIAAVLEVSDTEIRSFDYLPDWINVMAGWVLKS